MKKAVLGILVSALSAAAQAADTPVVSKINAPFTLMGASEALSCSKLDTDHDGIPETTRVSLKTNNAIHGTIGILQNRSIETDVVNDTEDTCGIVQKIKDQSVMMFGAVQGRYDSVVSKTDSELVEELSVTIISSGSLPAMPGETLVDPVTLRLHKTIIMPLN